MNVRTVLDMIGKSWKTLQKDKVSVAFKSVEQGSNWLDSLDGQ